MTDQSAIAPMRDRGARAAELMDRHCPDTADDVTKGLYRFLCLMAAMDGHDGTDDGRISPYLAVVEYGTAFACDNTDDGLAAAGLARGAKRDCARNAWRAMTDHDLVYVEGYGRHVHPGTWHAWNHDPAGCRSFDLTWRPDHDSPAAWIGIPFTLHAVLTTSADTGVYGLLPELPLTRATLADLAHPCLDALRATNGQPPSGLWP